MWTTRENVDCKKEGDVQSVEEMELNLKKGDFEDETLLQEHFCKSIRVHPELSVTTKDLKMTTVKDLMKVHNNAIDKEIQLLLRYTF